MADKQDGPDWVNETKEELTGIAKQGMKHPGTKPLLTGAAIGALGGALLPVITWPIGLAAGAGYAIYNRIKK
jgi:di/tricarboxylate transporter